MEAIIATSVQKELSQFNLNDFLSIVNKKKNELAGEIVETLLTLIDYEEFKQLMVSSASSGSSAANTSFDDLLVINKKK